MDEGKPTKPKWWSRPRTHVPDSAPADPVSAGDGTSGFHGGEGGGGGDMDGDFELEKPAGAGALGAPGAPGGGTADVVDAAGSDGLEAVVGGEAPAAGSIVAPGQVSGDASGGVDAPVERPKPLHDPDPYSTPPYGGPGPWAPAPPVQHPGTTPAHGTTSGHGMTPAHGTTSGHGMTPVHGAAPAHGATSVHGTAVEAAVIPSQGAPVGAGPEGASGASTQSGGAQGVLGSALPSGAPPGYALPTLVGSAAPVPPAPWQNYDPWAAAPLQQNGAAVETTAGRRRRTKRALVLGAALLALVSGSVGGAVGAYLERNGGIDDIVLPQADTEAKGRAPDSVAGIAASALPSVVTLHVSGSEAQGTGTGFVLDQRGHILTNNHVVDPADGSGEISVTFSGGQTAKAKVVGQDSGYDLAVVKVSGVRGLKPLALGNSDNVQVGDPVVAIGAPFDLENTVTAGIISAKERPITAGGEEGDRSDISYVDALQTDAPINPGNSGGPLVDSRARVIGINSAIRSADSGSDLEGSQSGSIGLGFAIPINQGKRVAEELINTGKATHPVIGVTLDMDYTGDGARVGTKSNDGDPPVNQGGPGERAGIKPGDVITRVDGQRVHSGEELIVKTRAHRPGDRLQLTLERDGKERKVTLVLGSADGD
ncbi:trypsin-like peptidase domain-containing protein [Streptomyces sp. NBC_00878]|uniref:trypsin-like peptidase domain-containing protein n=1 Tax=Streptomyces sp. NBC_00878 TaxID=2975854 RepID=UPI002250F18C|nr:trypsin-like peptidase domain-containing protein [Streptomyces sp. NBC_00878]MCX4905645.1 trypsin-like peptidase domain-containing protein [Streptomyces sp. NBC_00878]